MKFRKNKKTTNQLQYYMYGKHAVSAAIKNPNRNIHKIFCTNNFLSSEPEFLQNPDIKNKIQIVDNHFISNILKTDAPHQGIIAMVDSIYGNDLSELSFSDQKDKIVILDQITDPQNIGTIIRSAAAFGINKIIMPKDNTPDENATIAKAACGCLELVKIVKITNLKQSIDKLKEKGFWIAGMDGQGSRDLSVIKTIDKIAIIIGSEGKGMRKLTLDSCDYIVQIPIAREVESLNAASAASIIFYALS